MVLRKLTEIIYSKSIHNIFDENKYLFFKLSPKKSIKSGPIKFVL